MKGAFFIYALFSCAIVLLVWLVSPRSFTSYFSAAIFVGSSYSPSHTVSVCLPPALIASHGFKTRKFTLAAMFLSFFAGMMLLSAGLQYFCSVLTFYVAKSAVILYIWRHKLHFGGSSHPYPPLDFWRVAVKGLLPALICTSKLVLTRSDPLNSNCINCKIADVAFLSYVACCAGHGFSTELASVRFAKPRLITTWRSVMPGVSGGITLLSTIASAFGGGLIGIAFSALPALSPMHEPLAIAPSCWIKMGMLAGMLGSCFGSLLGATLMYSGFDTVTNKVVSHANSVSIEHVTGIDILNPTQISFLASGLTSASFAAVAWLKFSYSLN
jgi:uncharacterized membrane protein